MPSAGNGKGGSGGNSSSIGGGGGNKSQGDTDKGSRDDRSSSSSRGGSSSSSSRGGSGGDNSRGGSGGGNRSQGDSDKGSRDDRSAASASQKSSDRSKMENTKDKDMNPNGPAVSRQKERYEGNAQAIAETLADAGWKDHQIAGALGRLEQESSLNPGAVRKNDNMKAAPGLRDSVGIGQWNGTRQQALKDFAETRNASWKDVRTQASFLAHEMKTSKDETRAWNAMQKSTNVAEAATAMMHYERPQGYTPSNPAAGHGYKNTLNYASKYEAGNGLKTTLGADADPQAVASTSTAHQTLGRGTATGYVDPMVSSVAGRAAAGGKTTDAQSVVSGAVTAIDSLLGTNIASTVSNVQQKPEDRERLGLGKLGQKVEAKDGLGAFKEIAGAIRDPIGFALDTIEDGWNQNGGLAGLKSDLGGGFDFNFGSGKGGASGMASQGGDGSRINQGLAASGLGVVQEAAAAAIAPVTPAKIKPFGWSSLV